MPTYEYLCPRCGHRFESYHGMSDTPHESCPSCGGPVRRLISAGAAIRENMISRP